MDQLPTNSHLISALYSLSLLACTATETPPPPAPAPPVSTAAPWSPTFGFAGGEGEASFAINKTDEAVVRGTVTGLDGQLNMTSGKGVVHLSLDSLSTGNPLRDTILRSAFFGSIPPTQNSKKILAIWSKIEPSITRGVTQLTFRGYGLSGLPKSRPSEPFDVDLRGDLEVWANGTALPLNLKLTIAPQPNGSYLAHTTEPATVDLKELLGERLWVLINQALVAAGCPHPKGGIGPKVSFELKGARLIAL
jgi:hypothetical protein